MHANQHTSTNAKRNLNVRISIETLRRLNRAARARRKDKSDLVREALDLYLPLVEGKDHDRDEATP